VMAPYGRAQFPIHLGMNGSAESLGVVTWEDDLGEHEITVRPHLGGRSRRA
jgi:hypothetical protein